MRKECTRINNLVISEDKIKNLLIGQELVYKQMMLEYVTSDIP